MSNVETLWIVIPAFNEGSVIGTVVASVRARYPYVVVVDDCSRDDTGAAAVGAGAVVLRHPVNLGQGAALATGMRYVLSRGAEFLVTFDADGQHRTEDITVLVERQRETGSDVVLGSRFLGATPGMPPVRRFALKLVVQCMRLTGKSAKSDVHNGLRLFTRRAAQQIQIRQNRMAHASEIITQIETLGLSTCEAPVTIMYTKYSLSKGQRLSNGLSIIWDTVAARMYR